MKEEAKKRLERLLQDLQEIEEASSKRILCAVISSTLASPLHDRAAWQWVADFVRASRHEDDPIVLDPKPVVVEPFTDGKGCVRWCGSPEKRDKFKAWVVRLSGFLDSYPELVPDGEPGYGIEGGLQALCAIAATEPRYSSLVKRRTILNLAGKRTPPPKTPAKLQETKPKPSFDVLEINYSVSQFALKVLSRHLGKPIDPPPVTVDIEHSHVVVRGIVHAVDLPIALLVDQLVRANGNPITRKAIRKNCPFFAADEHVERTIAKIPELLPIDYDSNTTGFWLLPEWLA